MDVAMEDGEYQRSIIDEMKHLEYSRLLFPGASCPLLSSSVYISWINLWDVLCTLDVAAREGDYFEICARTRRNVPSPNQTDGQCMVQRHQGAG